MRQRAQGAKDACVLLTFYLMVPFHFVSFCLFTLCAVFLCIPLKELPVDVGQQSFLFYFDSFRNHFRPCSTA